MLPLDEGARVMEVKAPSARGGVFRLYEARTSDACGGRKDAWRMAGRFFALCQSTCASLREGGYERVEDGLVPDLGLSALLDCRRRLLRHRHDIAEGQRLASRDGPRRREERRTVLRHRFRRRDGRTAPQPKS